MGRTEQGSGELKSFFTDAFVIYLCFAAGAGLLIVFVGAIVVHAIGAESSALQASRVELIIFGTPDCAPCQRMKAEARTLAQEGLTIYYVDVSNPKNKALCLKGEVEFVIVIGLLFQDLCPNSLLAEVVCACRKRPRPQ